MSSVLFRDDFIFNEHVGSLSVSRLFHPANVSPAFTHVYSIKSGETRRIAAFALRSQRNRHGQLGNSCSTIDRLTLTIGRLRSHFLDVLNCRTVPRGKLVAPARCFSPDVSISIRGHSVSLLILAVVI